MSMYAKEFFKSFAKKVVPAIVLFALIVAAIILTGCQSDNSKPKPYLKGVQLSNWYLAYSSHAGGVKGSNTWFIFPNEPNPDRCAVKKHTCPSVHYLLKRVDRPIKNGGALEVHYKIDAPSVVWNHKLEPGNTSNHPASVAVMLQRKGDDMAQANGRFWLKNRKVLSHGSHKIVGALNRQDWINVYGKTPTAAAWTSMMNNLGNVGLTFGGGNFYGHGVNVTGVAKFTLTSYAFR